MTDYKNYKAEDKSYNIIYMVRDGLGIMTVAILGYFGTVLIFTI
jgi:hypothetical protein